MPKDTQRVVEVLSDEEIRRIYDVIHPTHKTGARQFAAITVLLDTGIRASELLGIAISDIDFRQNRIKERGKGKVRALRQHDRKGATEVDQCLSAANGLKSGVCAPNRRGYGCWSDHKDDQADRQKRPNPQATHAALAAHLRRQVAKKRRRRVYPPANHGASGSCSDKNLAASRDCARQAWPLAGQ